MKVKGLLLGILLLLLLTGCEKSGAPAVLTTDEMLFSFEGTTFSINQKSYDISQRHELINAIVACTPVGRHIVVEGHTGPKNAVYCIYNTETQSFEKDIIGANLIWHDNDINTSVYSFWSDICAFDGTVIASLALSEPDFITNLAFIDDNTRIEVTVETAADTYVKTIDLPS
jgi:hypothetical protein